MTKDITIVVNGDLKHEFGKISEQEWRETLKLIELLAKNCKKLLLTKGNHDKIVEPIAKKRNIDIITYKQGRVGSRAKRSLTSLSYESYSFNDYDN